MPDVQTRVRAMLESIITEGGETGLQVAAYLDGQLVVDAWAGLADSARRLPVNGDTLFTIFSCSKGLTYTIIHRLAERGLLDYDAPVAHYWPEFGTPEKKSVTVRHVLTHTAGLPQMPADITGAESADWDGICRRLAAERPVWTPGEAMGYHALSQGYLLGEVARRVTGRGMGALLQEEICQPLGVADLYFGLPASAGDRVATLEEDRTILEAPAPAPDALTLRAIPKSLGSLCDWSNQTIVRRAVIPAGGGIASARALARHYAALAGGVDGVQLLSAQRRALATTMARDEDDRVNLVRRRVGLGYSLGGPPGALGPRTAVFGHGGYGGSIGLADPEHRFAFALTKTRLAIREPGTDTASRVVAETRAALGLPA